MNGTTTNDNIATDHLDNDYGRCQECTFVGHLDDFTVCEESGSVYCEPCAMEIADEEFRLAMEADAEMSDAELLRILAEEEADIASDIWE